MADDGDWSTQRRLLWEADERKKREAEEKQRQLKENGPKWTRQLHAEGIDDPQQVGKIVNTAAEIMAQEMTQGRGSLPDERRVFAEAIEKVEKQRLQQEQEQKKQPEQVEAKGKEEAEKARASQPTPAKDAESREPADRARERGLSMFERFDAIRDREVKARANEQDINKSRETAHTHPNHVRYEPLKTIEPSRLSDNPLMEKSSDGRAEPKGEMTDSKSARFARMFSSEAAKTKEVFDATHSASNENNFARDGREGRGGR
jgi:hypothetical protein